MDALNCPLGVNVNVVLCDRLELHSGNVLTFVCNVLVTDIQKKNALSFMSCIAYQEKLFRDLKHLCPQVHKSFFVEM